MAKLSKARQEYVLRAYNNSSDPSIDYCYKNASVFKYRAERYIQNNDMPKFKGYDYRVLTANVMQFTCAFRYMDEQGQEHMRYYTAYNTYDFIIA